MNKKVLCPICRKETLWEGNLFRPFCSERCRTRDLGHWAAGNYAVPGEKVNASNEFLLDASPSPEKKHS